MRSPSPRRGRGDYSPRKDDRRSDRDYDRRDRDRSRSPDDRDRDRDREMKDDRREEDRENGTNGDDRKGTPVTLSTKENAMWISTDVPSSHGFPHPCS